MIGVSIYRIDTPYTLPSGANGHPEFDHIGYDTDGFANLGTHATSIIVPVGKSGVYAILIEGSFAAVAAAGVRYIDIDGDYLDSGQGVNMHVLNDENALIAYSVITRLNEGAEIKFLGYQDSGMNVDINSLSMTAIRLGPLP